MLAKNNAKFSNYVNHVDIFTQYQRYTDVKATVV